MGFYSFSGGPKYPKISREEMFDQALDTPMGVLETFGKAGGVGGAISSFGLGTVYKELTTPPGILPSPEEQLQRLREGGPTQVFTETRDLLKRMASAFHEQGKPLPPEEYKKSVWFRDRVPPEENMTDTRAAALAIQDDARSVREFYGAKRPIANFLGTFVGQALDPLNYVPFVSMGTRAAMIGKLGATGGRVLSSGLDALANTTAMGLLTREVRREYGDDVSWQTMTSEIAMSAAIGAGFGAIGAGVAKYRAGRASARARARAGELAGVLDTIAQRTDLEERLSDIRTETAARIPLDESVGAMARAEDVNLGPNSLDTVNRLAGRAAKDGNLMRTFVGETMFTRLRDIGELDPVNARMTARVIEDVYSTFARRAGIPLEELVQRRGLPEIRRGTRLAGSRPEAAMAAQRGVPEGEAPTVLSQLVETPAFRRWFGDSKVVDAEGRPLTVYHGTASEFDAFDPARRGEVTDTSDSKEAFWFTSSARRARVAATDAGGDRILSVYLRMLNPLVVDTPLRSMQPTDSARLIRNARQRGHDGVVFSSGEFGAADYAIFDPTQIKSVDNTGAFDPVNPNIYEQSTQIRRHNETLARYGLEPGRRHTTRDVAQALENRQRQKYGVVALTDYSLQTIRKLARWATEEVLFEIEKAIENPAKSAVGWYSVKFQRALDRFGARFPEFGPGDHFSDPNMLGLQRLGNQKNARDFFTALIAITSDGATVRDNLNQAKTLYEGFRLNGVFDPDFAGKSDRGAAMRGNLARIDAMLTQYGPDEMHRVLLHADTVTNLRKLAKERGEKFKTDYLGDAHLPYSAIVFGPKLGAFYANLMGDTGYLTMDRWWSRTINRYRGQLITKALRTGIERFKGLLIADRRLNITADMMTDDYALAALADYVVPYRNRNFKGGSDIEKAANTIYKEQYERTRDAPRTGSERAFMIEIARQTQDNLRRRGHDMTIADVQAVLWYYEKRLYGELGTRQTADISYEEIAREIANRRNLTGRPADEVAGEGSDALGFNPADDAHELADDIADDAFDGSDDELFQSAVARPDQGGAEQAAAGAAGEPAGSANQEGLGAPPPPGTHHWFEGPGGHVPVNADGMFRITHESDRALDAIDPLKRRFIRGNRESQRLGPVGTPGTAERAYYGVGDLNYVRPADQPSKLQTDPYHGEGRGNYRHTVAVRPERIYNFDEDVMGLWARTDDGLVYNERLTQYEKLIEEAGFAGTYHPASEVGQVAMLFEKVEPEFVLNTRYDLPANEVARPSDFDAPTAKTFHEKGGWAILTGTKEADGAFDAPANVAANKHLRNVLKKNGIKFKEVGGVYQGVDQGTSFMIFAPEAEARALGARFGQESILTRNGLEYTDGSGRLVPSVASKTVIGDAARKEDFYSVMRGTAVHVGLDAPRRLRNLPSSSTGPIKSVVDAAHAYAESIGLPIRRQAEYVKADPERGARIAAAYDAMEHAPNDPAVATAYQAMIDETLAQYQFVKATGLTVEAIEPGQADPYPGGPKEVLADLQRGHLWFFPTEQGFGSSGADVSGNPLLAPTGEFIGDRELLANDVFRIVHDFFGHGIEGSGFGARGEENAWQSHMRLYSETALPAVTSETRGQNSWVNFGPHGKANRANQRETVYADQKTGIMPEWTWREGVVDDLADDAPVARGGGGEAFSMGLDFDTPAALTRASKEFKAWFRASRIADANGNPKVVYHGTRFNEPFEEFWPMSHFGTVKAAEDRIGLKKVEGQNIYPVYLRIENPLDLGDEWSPVGTWQNDADMFRQIAAKLGREVFIKGDGGPDPALHAAAMRMRELADASEFRSMHSLRWRAEAATVLEAVGYDGIVYKNAAEDIGSISYVAFRPEQVKSVNNTGAFGLDNPDLLFQSREAPRGSIRLGDKPVITLFEAADASTAIHEGSHLFLKLFKDLADHADAPEALRADWELTKGWWRANADAVAAERPGVITADDVRMVLDKGTTGDAAKDAAVDIGLHEQWARGFEAYLREGVAPTPELRGVFQQFKEWLTQIYRSAKALGVEMSPEIRGVFDRMLGADAPRTPDTSVARVDPMPAGRMEAEARLLKPEDTKALAEQFRVNPETGAFDEQVEIDRLAAAGKLTADEVKALDVAKADFDAAVAYGDVLQTLAGRTYFQMMDPELRDAALFAAGDKLSGSDIEAAWRKLRKHEEKLRRMGDIANIGDRIAAFAAREAERTRVAAALARRHVALNIKVRDQLDRAVKDMVTDGLTPVQALRAYLEGSPKFARGSRNSIYAMRQSFERSYTGGLMAEMQANRPHLINMLRDSKLDADVAIEMGEIKPGGKPGVTKNPDAVFLAKLFHSYTELARTDLNRRGANIGKLEGWFGPQTHDDLRMIAAGKTTWVNTVFDLLDHERSFPDAENVAEIREILEGVYDTITTGVSDAPNAALLGQRVNPANLAKRLGKSRVLHFKTAEAALKYRADFGVGNTISGIMNHLRASARTAAAMEVLGPNPEVMLNGIIESMKRSIANDANLTPEAKVKQLAGLTTDAGPLRQALDIATGLQARPVSVNMANIAQNVRSLQAMAKLGGALMSQFSDTVIAAAASQFRGSGFLRGFVNQLDGLRRGRPKGEFAEISYLLGEGFDGLLGQITNPNAAIDGPVGSFGSWAEKFYRWNGMSWWTDIQRAAAGRMIAAEMAMRARVSFDDLPRAYRQVLQMHAIDAIEWDAVRSIPSRLVDGKAYITPDRVVDIPDDKIEATVADRLRNVTDEERRATIIADGRRRLELKLGAFVADEVTYGVIETDARSRRTSTLGLRPGTMAGESIRMLMQFKGFPIAFAQRVLGRAIWGYGPGRRVEQAAHIGTLLAGMTAMGYLSMTAKDAVRGYWPPREVNKASLAAAFIQGGAAGIYGDFLFSQVNRFGGGLAETTMGPGFGSTFDLAELALKTVHSAVSDSDAPRAADFLNFALQNTPYINLYYTRPALDYLFLHSLRELVSPGFNRRQTGQRREQFGQERMLEPMDPFGSRP